MKLWLAIIASVLGVMTSVFGEDANTWTGAESWFSSDSYSDSARWSLKHLPNEGDDVVFCEKGFSVTTMILNLADPMRLGSIYVTGSGLFTINEASGTESLYADVLRNDTPVRINASSFQPDKVDPSAQVTIAIVRDRLFEGATSQA